MHRSSKIEVGDAVRIGECFYHIPDHKNKTGTVRTILVVGGICEYHVKLDDETDVLCLTKDPILIKKGTKMLGVEYGTASQDPEKIDLTKIRYGRFKLGQMVRVDGEDDPEEITSVRVYTDGSVNYFTDNPMDYEYSDSELDSLPFDAKPGVMARAIKAKEVCYNNRVGEIDSVCMHKDGTVYVLDDHGLKFECTEVAEVD